MPHEHSPKVKCVVNTCTHYVPGDLCGAANIDVIHEEEGKMSKNSEQTQCKTFQIRSSFSNILGSLDNVNLTGALSEPFISGTQLTPSVTCIVDSCKYWDKGDLCGAEKIYISGRDADECQDTNCATYLPNNEG
ncbi:hypothetical protein BBF96_01330 [Anoxybacter fermentans]|uniref:DUF1540 domain-containing protein n=1 Tax=Anoxybacter fermentans TaxID=1323375 RepID=A0A3S9SV53_9FIRM|nr:DUF1540 domain-containing protein [Anoxybacter fermentans]AZR72152.1 hypothetical protein BBF96_01330 [Anoxybacter fermentans]